MLLPTNRSEWVAGDDLVTCVIHAVERLSLSRFAVNHKGCDNEQYPSHRMLALLTRCHAGGIFSDRRIERATGWDAAVRHLTINPRPDHDTLCAFRRNNRETIAATFVDMLELARELTLLKRGTVRWDGTHLRADASKDKNVTCQRAQQWRAPPRQDADALLAQTQTVYQRAEDPQALPGEMARRERLLQELDEACARGGKSGPSSSAEGLPGRLRRAEDGDGRPSGVPRHSTRLRTSSRFAVHGVSEIGNFLPVFWASRLPRPGPG